MNKKLLAFPLLGLLAISSFGFALKTNTTQYQNYVVIHADEGSYYSSITEDMSGTTLLNKLYEIVNSGNIARSYDWSRYEEADEDPNNKDNIITIYARTSMKKTDHVSGSKGWNREHTFPQSKMDAQGSKSDNHIIFASDNKVNGARGNIKMGVVDNGTVVKDSNGNNTTCRKSSNLFDPHNVSRGIVARSTMYAAAMYKYDPEDNFESIETMLSWHLENAVSAQDKTRNEVIYKNQHNRNPFVDHPEYACRIWGNTNSTTKSICANQPVPPDPDPTKTPTGLDVTPPTKLDYKVGETLDQAGMKVYIHYDDDSQSAQISSGYTVSPTTFTTVGETTVTVSLTVDNVALTGSFKVNVSKADPSEKTLVDLEITPPTKLNYQVGETLDKTGMKVYPHYSDDTYQSEITNYTVSPEKFETAGETTVTVSATVEGKALTGSFKVNVSAQAPAKGCGGDITTTSVVLSSLAFVGATGIIISTILRKKKKEY